MKKRIAAMAVMLLLSLTACSSDVTIPEVTTEESGSEQTLPVSEPDSAETSDIESTTPGENSEKAPAEETTGAEVSDGSAQASIEESISEPPAIPDKTETSAADTSPAVTENTSAQTSEVTSKPANNENNETQNMEISDNNMETSIRLFDKISDGSENSMFSPLSLNMALGLLEAGAGGSSKTVLDAYLGTDSYADFAEGYMKKVRETYNSQESWYTDEVYKNCFEIANSLWADKTLPLKSEYKDSVSEKFDAEIRNVDFGNKKKTLKAINGWVNDKTHKLIPTALNDYGEDTAAVLVNTVYFESGWINEWNYFENNKKIFTLSDGSEKEMPLMINSGDSFFENEKATAFSSTYRNGMEFIGILPKSEGDFTLEELDIPSLLESRSYDYDVTAEMPRLNYETDIPLTGLLKDMGLRDIFDENKADFSGISDLPLFVSGVIQKTKLELDENGTKAAAVTAIVAATSAMPVEREIKEVFLDRPFAFLIYDRSENQIVFIGKVMNP